MRGRLRKEQIVGYGGEYAQRIVSVCARVHACVHACARAHVHTSLWRTKYKLGWVIFLYNSLPEFMRQDFSLNLERTDIATLAVHEVPGVPL